MLMSGKALDIGSQSIKLVELSKRKGVLTLTNYAYAKTSESLVKVGMPGVISDIAGKVLKRALDAADIKTKEVNVAVPSFSSLVTVFDIPKMPDKEVDQAIRSEAPKYIPVRLSDVVYGWQVIDETGFNENSSGQAGQTGQNSAPGGNLQRMKVLVVAIMKEISGKYEKVLGDSGIGVGSLEIDSFSLVRSLLHNDPECSLILDIGHRVTNLIVAANGNILVNRTIDVAGESMTNVLEKSLKVDQKRAEQLKMQSGMRKDGQGKSDLFLPTLGIIIQEVKKTISVLGEEYNGLNIKKVVLSGGSARMIGLAEYVQNELKIKTVIGNPLAQVKYPAKMEAKLKLQSPVLAVAVGLAMLGLEE